MSALAFEVGSTAIRGQPLHRPGAGDAEHVTDARCETLRAQLMAAEDFAATLRRRLRPDA